MEMQYCFEHGIPYSTFIEWSNEDRARVIAFVLEKSTRCQMCGTAEWEWNENRFAYEPVSKYCHGCHLKEISAEDRNRTPGVTIELMPTGTVESAKRFLKAKRDYERREKKRR